MPMHRSFDQASRGLLGGTVRHRAVLGGKGSRSAEHSRSAFAPIAVIAAGPTLGCPLGPDLLPQGLFGFAVEESEDREAPALGDLVRPVQE